MFVLRVRGQDKSFDLSIILNKVRYENSSGIVFKNL